MESAVLSQRLQNYPCQKVCSNLCLAARDGELRSLLSPHLELVDLVRGQFFKNDDPSSSVVLFPLSGILTLFYGEVGQQSSAIAIIGHEGIANYHLLFAPPLTPYELVVQMAGEALAINADAMRHLLLESSELRSAFDSYGMKIHLQIAATLRSSLRDSIGTRLARLLLMYHDRIEGDEIPIIHSTMAAVLSVRRASITDAMHILEGYHAVRDSRGRTTITDRDLLISFAAESYGRGEEIYGEECNF